MGAILRSRRTPPWNFRCRGAMLTTEESLFVDGSGEQAQAALFGPDGAATQLFGGDLDGFEARCRHDDRGRPEDRQGRVAAGSFSSRPFEQPAYY